MRYEDLVINKEYELVNMFKFLLDLDSLDGTNIERRIKEVVSLGEQSAMLYKLKSTTLRFNSNKVAYTQSQIDYIKETNRDFIHRFGYCNHPSDKDNFTSFYDYPD